MAREYASLLPWYEDFYQRRQLGKVKKLTADRAALPISAFHEQIVQAVRQHPAVVVAGDTGTVRARALCSINVLVSA